MNFYDWYHTASTAEAAECRKRVAAGEKGNESNPYLACQCAYDAGVREGFERAKRNLIEAMGKP